MTPTPETPRIGTPRQLHVIADLVGDVYFGIGRDLHAAADAWGTDLRTSDEYARLWHRDAEKLAASEQARQTADIGLLAGRKVCVEMANGRKPAHLDFLKFNEACNDALNRAQDAALAPKEKP